MALELMHCGVKVPGEYGKEIMQVDVYRYICPHYELGQLGTTWTPPKFDVPFFIVAMSELAPTVHKVHTFNVPLGVTNWSWKSRKYSFPIPILPILLQKVPVWPHGKSIGEPSLHQKVPFWSRKR